MDQTAIEIINMLSVSVLLKIKKQCENYITYTIDFKQVNNKNAIKTRQKVFAEILEQVNTTLVFKQVENEKLEVKETNAVKSTYTEQLPQDNTSDKNNNAKI